MKNSIHTKTLITNKQRTVFFALISRCAINESASWSNLKEKIKNKSNLNVVFDHANVTLSAKVIHAILKHIKMLFYLFSVSTCSDWLSLAQQVFLGETKVLVANKQYSVEGIVMRLSLFLDNLCNKEERSNFFTATCDFTLQRKNSSKHYRTFEPLLKTSYIFVK